MNKNAPVLRDFASVCDSEFHQEQVAEEARVFFLGAMGLALTLLASFIALVVL